MPARLLVLAIALATLGRPAGADPRRALVVVVAKDSKITGLSHAALRRCFKGETVEVDDLRLAPFNFAPGSSERIDFDRAVLGMSPEEVGRFWVDRKIRGQSPPPRALPSATYMAKIVARFPGAIGYLPADQVTAELKVIAIDGLAKIER
jgi:hypothetical protein